MAQTKTQIPKIISNPTISESSKIGDLVVPQDDLLNCGNSKVISSPRANLHQVLLVGENTPKPSSKHCFKIEKDNINKTLEALEIVIFATNAEIEEIRNILGYEEIKSNLLLKCTQKIEATRNHVILVNQHFDKIAELENITEQDQETLFNVLNIAGIAGDDKEKAWLLAHNWKGLLNDSTIKELIEDNVNDRDQKERIGSIIISKY